jgi:hypothetical protein
MVVKKYCYECPKCNSLVFVEEGKYFSKICSNCDVEMKLEGVYDCDTELAEKVQNTPPYNPTKDPKSPYYIPTVTCPYCHSTSTKKISTASKVAHTAVVGVFSISRNSKQWHCNKCGADF